MKSYHATVDVPPTKHPAFRPSKNAFDAVAENRFTYGKAKIRPKGRAGTGEWDIDKTLLPNFVDRRLPRSSDAKHQGNWVTEFTPKVNPDGSCGPNALSLYDRTQARRTFLKSQGR
jgi:hypothetical protein